MRILEFVVMAMAIYHVAGQSLRFVRALRGHPAAGHQNRDLEF